MKRKPKWVQSYTRRKKGTREWEPGQWSMKQHRTSGKSERKERNSRWVGTHRGCYQPQPWTTAPEFASQLESPPATCVPLGKFLCLSSLNWKRIMFSFIYSIGLLWELTDLIQVLRTVPGQEAFNTCLPLRVEGIFFFNTQWPRGEQFQAISRNKNYKVRELTVKWWARRRYNQKYDDSFRAVKQ